MAYYLVEAAAKEERLPELEERLEKDEFLSMRPFGASVTFALRGARRRPDGGVVWEERGLLFSTARSGTRRRTRRVL